MADPTRYYIVATAGHVDHGKSALVKALSGTDPDRLPEEKARGITIDLGFAHFDLQSGPHLCRVGLVDVPGHEDFVKNMVAGVGAVDLALLTVAADDGWMPQSEEHLQILRWLGVRHGVVALTKADLAPDRLGEREAELRTLLKATPFANAPIIPTSVVSGEGIDTLRAALATQLADLAAQPDLGKPRLPVDRVFTLQGLGTVVTGTLSGGQLERGQAALVQPVGAPVRIRSIQCYGADVPRSGPGRRTALNLVDLPPSRGIRRGDVISMKCCGEPTWTVDVALSGSTRALSPVAPFTLKSGARIRVHHGSAHASARVFLLDRDRLGPGEETLAELRLESPLLIFAGDRFVLRDWAQQHSLAGGMVLDARARPRRFRTPAQRELLARRAQAPHDAAVWIETELARDRCLPAAGLLVQTAFRSDEVAASAARLEQGNRIARGGSWLLAAAWWRELRKDAAAAIDQFHQQHPELPGMELAQLQIALDGRLPAPDCFPLLVDGLGADGFVRLRTVIRRGSHRPVLPPELRKEGDRIRAALAAKPLEPPARKELAPDRAGQQALRFLQDTGEVIGIGDEVVLLAESYSAVEARIVELLTRQGSATVSGLRQVLGTTRRVLVPLLEKLDREAITARQGDMRVLGRRGAERRK